MKIVLNKCFGGFGLSHEAKMEIFKRKNIEVFPYIADDSSFSSDSNRGDKDLVAVVEKLGSEASGPHASLKVVDIPDGAEWEISDYDGIETAHYGFQTGSI